MCRSMKVLYINFELYTYICTCIYFYVMFVIVNVILGHYITPVKFQLILKIGSQNQSKLNNFAFTFPTLLSLSRWYIWYTWPLVYIHIHIIEAHDRVNKQNILYLYNENNNKLRKSFNTVHSYLKAYELIEWMYTCIYKFNDKHTRYTE